MNNLLTKGKPVPFKKLADRRALVGKRVIYLRDVDIDKTGRGYFFPRYDTVTAAYKYGIEMSNGTWITVGDLKEVNLLDESVPTDSTPVEGGQ